MTLSVTFNARTDFPKVVPVLVTTPPRWDLKRTGALARELGTRTKVVDAGPWYIARDERIAVEVFQGSNRSGSAGATSTVRPETAPTGHPIATRLSPSRRTGSPLTGLRTPMPRSAR